MNLTFAFAVSATNAIESQHFGEADKFLLLELNEKGWQSAGEIVNPLKGAHGSREEGRHSRHRQGRKADSIIALLRELGVQILVSRQFGPNIRRVCEHFVPVLVSESSILATGKKIADRQAKIEAECKDHSGAHNILRIMEDGVLTIPLKPE